MANQHIRRRPPAYVQGAAETKPFWARADTQYYPVGSVSNRERALILDFSLFYTTDGFV